MKVESRGKFDSNYKEGGYREFTLKVTTSQLVSIVKDLNGYFREPGDYSIFGRQCTSVAVHSLMQAGLDLKMWDQFAGFIPLKPDITPSALNFILSQSINNTVVTNYIDIK